VIQENEKGWEVCDDRSILSPTSKVTQNTDLNTFSVTG
jgi:hypothetical protein